MPTPSDSTTRNVAAARQRSDHAHENAEDYVELISELQAEIGAAHKSDIAARLGVSHVTVHKTIKRLKTLGLVQAESYRAVSLTEAGRLMATEARERHLLVYSFLQHLGVPDEQAAADAEGIEHHIGPETIRCMQRFCSAMDKDSEFKRPRQRRPAARKAHS